MPNRKMSQELTDLCLEIKDTSARFFKDVEKAVDSGGNLAAFKRARVNSLELEVLLKAFRRQTLEYKNQRN